MTDTTKLPALQGSAFDMATSLGDLTGGVTIGFTSLSIKGSKWKTRQAGEGKLIADAEGEAKPYVEVIILNGSKNKSNVYYAKGYAEGDENEPDCAASDGMKPDAGVPNPQAKSCAACPHSVWGSRKTESGGDARACNESRRIAVTFADDIMNEDNGGAMLLRIPSTSVRPLYDFGNIMERRGYHYSALVTRLGFNPDVAYPQLTFKAARPITNDEGLLIQKMKDEQAELIDRIVNAKILVDSNMVRAGSDPLVDTEFDDEEEGVVVEVKAKSKVTKKRVAKKKPAVEIVKDTPEEPAIAVDDDDESDEAKLESVMALLGG